MNGYGHWLDLSSRAAAWTGCGLAFTAWGTRMGVEGAVEWAGVSLLSLPTSCRLTGEGLRYAGPLLLFPASISQALSV